MVQKGTMLFRESHLPGAQGDLRRKPLELQNTFHPGWGFRSVARIPKGMRSSLGAVGSVPGWRRAGAGVAQQCIKLGVELVELPHPLLVGDLPLLERDLSQLVVDDGSPVQHRQPASPARQ